MPKRFAPYRYIKGHDMNHQALILQQYEAVRESSSSMLHAARQSDWEALVAGERRCAELIGRLQQAEIGAATLEGPARSQAHALIRAILANDAEIRDLTQPWLRQLETHLGGSRTSRQLAAVYRP